mmetsp:Transcript_57260/g.124402  ORF Transcript_57260/g.124402 Transcript_57260/m.124402 type:complete len:157 (+) Transcript_57260:28-498(+)
MLEEQDSTPLESALRCRADAWLTPYATALGRRSRSTAPPPTEPKLHANQWTADRAKSTASAGYGKSVARFTLIELQQRATPRSLSSPKARSDLRGLNALSSSTCGPPLLFFHDFHFVARRVREIHAQHRYVDTANAQEDASVPRKRPKPLKHAAVR